MTESGLTFGSNLNCRRRTIHQQPEGKITAFMRLRHVARERMVSVLCIAVESPTVKPIKDIDHP